MKGVVFLMKRLFVFICLVALISFAVVAFAADGGHVNPDAKIDTTPVADYTPVSTDVTGTGGTVTLVPGDIPTPTEFKVADIFLPTSTANKIAVMSNVKVNVTVDPGATEVTIKFANYTDTNTKDLYAFIKAHTTSGIYVKDKFYSFLCTVSTDKVLSFTVTNPEVFFSENTVVLATAKTEPTSGGSSGGCNAGYAGLLLFAAVPFFFRKKK